MTLRFKVPCCEASTVAASYRCTNTKGFTLIETMVTLVLLALLMGLVMPLGINSVERANGRAELIELKRFIVYAREYAYNRGRRVELLFDGTAVIVKEQARSNHERLRPQPLTLKPQTFETLFFTPQRVVVNELGFVNVSEIVYQSQGRQNSLSFNAMRSAQQ